MRTMPESPKRGDRKITEQSVNEANEDFEWVDALLDQFQLCGKPVKELHAAWERAVMKLAAA